MEAIRRKRLYVIAVCAALALSFFGDAKAEPMKSRAVRTTPNRLRAAHYMASCPFFDASPGMKVGQVIFAGKSIAGLVYDESIISLSSSPWTPQGYILRDERGNLFVSTTKNGTILNVHGGSFTRIGSPGTTQRELRKVLAPLLRYPYTPNDITVRPCFSRPWDGRYAR